MYSEITQFIHSLDSNAISVDRKTIAQPLIDFIQNKVNAQDHVRLIFICTHNSRRSHLAQIWAQVIAAHFEIPRVQTYSGGTETTALFPYINTTLQKQGLKIEAISEGSNPIYAIKYSDNHHPIIGFSKAYDHFFNPRSNFAAIMTCAQAESGCPFIIGAEKRISIPYEDPKNFDDTSQQESIYSERSLQIATELHYVFSQITLKS